MDSDETFAFIVGYTSGGGPFGLTHEEWLNLTKNLKTPNHILTTIEVTLL